MEGVSKLHMSLDRKVLGYLNPLRETPATITMSLMNGGQLNYINTHGKWSLASPFSSDIYNISAGDVQPEQ